MTGAGESGVARTYVCGSCGGHATWQPVARQVACVSCGVPVALPAADTTRARSFFLVPFLRDSPENRRSFTRTRAQTACPTCGSIVVFDPGLEAIACGACRTPLLRSPLEDDAPLRPTGIVPFRLAEPDAREGIRAWWRKEQRRRRLDLGPLTPRYLPYWQFSIHVHCPWRATVQSTDIDGRRHIEIRSGEVTGDYGEREPGTRRVAPALLKSLPFPFDDAVTFDPRYLAGAIVEQYEVGLWDAWDASRGRLETLVEWLVKKDAGTMSVPDELWPSWSQEPGAAVIGGFVTSPAAPSAPRRSSAAAPATGPPPRAGPPASAP